MREYLLIWHVVIYNGVTSHPICSVERIVSVESTADILNKINSSKNEIDQIRSSIVAEYLGKKSWQPSSRDISVVLKQFVEL